LCAFHSQPKNNVDPLCISGDFAILINSGMPVKKALLYNFLSACTAFGGLTLGIIMGELETSIYVFAFAGGLFLYVSLADLVSIKIKIQGIQLC
jgi:zinc transporter ZupT